MNMRIIRAGMLTTIQDLGRPGLRAAGVPVGGAMDSFALRLANLLVGNPEDAPCLEMTMVGAEIVFEADTVVAVTGASGGELESWQPHAINAGTRLKWEQFDRGYRAYLAVAGGVSVPAVLGGHGTYLRAGWGGWQGRKLRDGDVIDVKNSADRMATGNWRLDRRLLPEYSTTPDLRMVRGEQIGEFDRTEWSGMFEVLPQSDRMGLRLRGKPLRRSSMYELISTAVAPGTVQVPPDGQPIVLGVDAQTIGGYPQLAHVIGLDQSLLAQLRPGDNVRFTEVTLAEAHRLTLERERALAILREGLRQKLQ